MFNALANYVRDRERNALARRYDLEKTNALMSRKALVDNARPGALGDSIEYMQNDSGGDPIDNLGALASFAPGIGDAVGLATDVRHLVKNPESRTPMNFMLTGAGALPFIPAMSAITAFHGSPHKFDAFDMSKIGTGEGAQAYGHGLYFAENPDVAKMYQDTLRPLGGHTYRMPDGSTYTTGDNSVSMVLDHFTPDGNPRMRANWGDKSQWSEEEKADLAFQELSDFLDKIGDGTVEKISAPDSYLYKTDIPDEAIENMLDWDAPDWQQPKNVKEFSKNIDLPDEWAGNDLVHYAKKQLGAEKASQMMEKAGIPGIKYFDGGSRASSQGTRNFVVFDDKLPKILKRE